MSETPADDLRSQLTDVIVKVTGKKYLTKASRNGIDEAMQLIAQDRAKLLQGLLAEKQTVKVMVNRRFVTEENFEVVPVAAIKALQKVTEG